MKKLVFVSLLFCFSCGGDDLDEEKPASGWRFSPSSVQMGEPKVSPDLGSDVESDAMEEPDHHIPEKVSLGDRCGESLECEGGLCLNFPDGGYCSESCEDDNDCQNGVCTKDGYCALECQGNDECRRGYSCKASLGSRACLPTQKTTKTLDGEACENDNECQGGTCITEWPEGYCTTIGCNSFSDCARGEEDLNNRCYQRRGAQNLCVRICATHDECRDGYVCQPISRNEGFCVPDPSVPVDPAALKDFPFDLTCVDVDLNNGEVTYPYTISENTSAYQITPLNIDGRRLRPVSITLPDNSLLDFSGRNRIQSVGAQLYGSMNPTVVPAIPQFSDQAQTGKHVYNLLSESEKTCFYQVEETQPGTVVDLNIYLVGVPSMTAATAPQNMNMQETMRALNAIYAPSGITIGKIRYTDITGADAQNYTVLRSETAVSELVALSKPLGKTKDEALTMNVFFVQSFALGGAIGISRGLPGPAGLHGTSGSGVAFTTEFMGRQVQDRFGNGDVSGNELTAQTMAHEMGHFLGLFHTTEQNGGHDPLADTPECGRINPNCPDLTNLMFPFAGNSHTTITPDQNFVLGVHPLTKTVTP